MNRRYTVEKYMETIEEAKRKKLESRMLKDMIFIILGIVFLIISIFSAYNKKQNETKTNNDDKITTTSSHK